MKAEFLKHHYTLERGDNNAPVITLINKFGGEGARAPYCGNTIGYFCEQSGVQVIDFKPELMSLAANWGRKGKVVWDGFNGWRTAQRQPADDEIWVLHFFWEKRNHVGMVVECHGGLRFVTGEGNTSEKMVRVLGDTKYQRPSQTKAMPYRQGIFVSKERYNTTGLVRVVKFKVKIWKP